MGDGDGDSGVPFGTFRLVGGRYERPGLPVASAAELVRYERLVKAVAHYLFLRRMKNRRRVPRGFEGRLDLRLVDVQPGSVIPVLERSRFGDGMLLPTDWHEEARRLINSALVELNAAQPSLPAEFPLETLKEFAQFGRSLTDAEYIQLSGPGETPANLNTQTRKTIQRLADLDHLEVELVVVGQVTGLRSVPQQFDVTVASDGKKFTGAYLDPLMWESLKELQGYGSRAPLAALSVVADQSPSGELLAIRDVLGVEAALPPEWQERLAHLTTLGRGWLDEGSEPPSALAVDQAEELLFAFVDEQWARPGIYPLAQGGVQFEWSSATGDVEVTLRNDGGVGGFGTDSTGEIFEVDLDIRDIDAVLGFVRGFLDRE